jgi:hypothetical protein
MSISRVSKPLLVLFVLALLFVSAGVASAQMGKGWFQVDSLWAESNLRVDGEANLNTNLTVGDDLVIGDDLTVGNFLHLTAATAISLTNGGIITATSSYQPIDAAPSTTVTPTIAAGSAGQLLRLVNQGTGTIRIIDTGTAKLSADYDLGQYDSLLLMSDGTNWIEMGRSNN